METQMETQAETRTKSGDAWSLLNHHALRLRKFLEVLIPLILTFVLAIELGVSGYHRVVIAIRDAVAVPQSVPPSNPVNNGDQQYSSSIGSNRSRMIRYR